MHTFKHLGYQYEIFIQVINVFRKMYWLDSSLTQSIQQANLDGTEISAVVNTSSSSTLVFTLDVDNDRIYWIDKDNGKIMYSDLQGNNQTQLVSGYFDSRTIAAYGNN